MHDPLEGDRLDRYLAGALDGAEAEQVRAALEANAGRRGVMAGVSAWMRGDDLGETPPAVETALEQLRGWMDRAGAVPERPRGPTVGGMKGAWTLPRGVFKAQPLPRRLWSSAIAFALAVALIMLGWNAGEYHLAGRAALSALTYTTEAGERATITLPDGNTVALDVASRLIVPADYVTGNHTVRLVGEGIFTVVHHTRIPLTVLAGPATVRVLGTRFLVRKYATDTTMTVAVQDGKVAVQSTVLTAAQQIVIGRSGVGAVQTADPAQFSFMTGTLALDGIPFPEAIAELDRWYNADLRLGDPKLATLQMTSEFGAGSLAELSEILVHTYNVRVVRNGRVLTLYPRQ